MNPEVAQAVKSVQSFVSFMANCQERIDELDEIVNVPLIAPSEREKVANDYVPSVKMQLDSAERLKAGIQDHLAIVVKYSKQIDGADDLISRATHYMNNGAPECQYLGEKTGYRIS
jgi:hypothetical protein